MADETRPHRVALLVSAPLSTFDMAAATMAFTQASTADGRPAYEIEVCTARPGTLAGYEGVEVVVRGGLDTLAEADTVLVSGHAEGPGADETHAALRAAAARGARLASLCGGAVTLAEAGLLPHGSEAAVNWRFADDFRRRFPDIRVRTDILYTETAPYIGSGHGGAADLCFALIRNDYGTAVANDLGRRIIAAPARHASAGQPLPTAAQARSALSLAATRAWASAHLDEPLTLAALARHARTSVRTLSRRWQEETGSSPLRWVLQQRLNLAQELLESTDLTVERIARRTGLGSPDSLRHHLVAATGLTPTGYRKRSASPAPPLPA
ncbi:helix-turn-helix domain-containing protein [Streptomyces sp. A7024]|uniref:Helix-turn-helix domain-containing protein n=1 Tax=Streptomyces coryli TaxID=1128680 RepID=A0A6G4TVK1_9ACTN|nr:helix-turn-helix domain-containing protein [Streptomyces coryli]NGN63550.1 helix-turn-helix domain-containing protein [Streptomyces coryli]